MSANVKRQGLRVLVLTLAATLASVTADPATASGRHGHGVEGGWHHGEGSDPDRYLTKLTPSQIPHGDDTQTENSMRSQPAMSQVHAIEAHAISTGAGIKIAVCDGGWTQHTVLAGHLSGGWDSVDEDADVYDHGNGIDDDNDGIIDNCVGHGTFVSSLILSVAPDVTIIPIRSSDDEGTGSIYDLVNSMEYAMDQGADIINLSMVMPFSDELLKNTLREAANRGILCSGSAGYVSNGWTTAFDLQNRLLGVGGVTSANFLEPFSPTGIYVDVYAPADDLIGALGIESEDSYGHWDGTSFSTPIVSGVAALVKSHEPNLFLNDVVGRIKNHEDAGVNIIPMIRGRVNAMRALNNN